MTRVANGRWSRCYFWPTTTRDNYLAVTYHHRVGGKLRQLTVSPRLLRKVLR